MTPPTEPYHASNFLDTIAKVRRESFASMVSAIQQDVIRQVTNTKYGLKRQIFHLNYRTICRNLEKEYQCIDDIILLCLKDVFEKDGCFLDRTKFGFRTFPHLLMIDIPSDHEILQVSKT
jgi:hypothetical protein